MYSNQPRFGSLSCEDIVSMVQVLLSIYQNAVYQCDHIRMNLSIDTALLIMDATRDFISYALVLQKYYQSSISQTSFSGLSILFNHQNIFRISTRDDVYLLLRSNAFSFAKSSHLLFLWICYICSK